MLLLASPALSPLTIKQLLDKRGLLAQHRQRGAVGLDRLELLGRLHPAHQGRVREADKPVFTLLLMLWKKHFLLNAVPLLSHFSAGDTEAAALYRRYAALTPQPTLAPPASHLLSITKLQARSDCCLTSCSSATPVGPLCDSHSVLGLPLSACRCEAGVGVHQSRRYMTHVTHDHEEAIGLGSGMNFTNNFNTLVPSVAQLPRPYEFADCHAEPS